MLTYKQAEEKEPIVLEWKDVDNPPEVGEYVLINCNTDTVLKGVLYNGGVWMVFFQDGFFECKNVTHWMPLPEAPVK